MYEEEQRLNKSEREEIVPRYRSTSLPYYQKDHENVEFEQKFKIVNLRFVMWLSKKPQLKA
jgi:hypothetical protein